MQNSLLLLGGLSDTSMSWLKQVCQRLILKEGEILIQEGVRIENVFILLSGSLLVTTAAPEIPDRRRLVARLTVGEIIGEMSFIDHRPPSATVTAENDCVLHAVSQKVLQEKVEQDIEFGREFYQGLAYCLSNRLRMMNVSLPQAGIEVNGTLPPELDNPAIQASLSTARARLKMLTDIET
jgi:CRP-like cAMP-binding protein